MKIVICLMTLCMSQLAFADGATVECNLSEYVVSGAKTDVKTENLIFNEQSAQVQEKSFDLFTGDKVTVSYSKRGSNFTGEFYFAFSIEIQRGESFSYGETVAKDLDEAFLKTNMQSSGVDTRFTLSNCILKKNAQPEPIPIQHCAQTQELCFDFQTGKPYCATKCNNGGW